MDIRDTIRALTANRDPEVVADPERIDPGRDPRPHLAFGNGAHRRTRAVLARLHTGLLVGTLLDRLPGAAARGLGRPGPPAPEDDDPRAADPARHPVTDGGRPIRRAATG